MIAYTLTPDSLAVSDSTKTVHLRGPVHAFWAREEQRALSHDWTDALDVLHHAQIAGLTCEDAPSKPSKRKARAVKAPVVETPVGDRYVLASAIKALPSTALALYSQNGALFAGVLAGDTVAHAYQIGAWPGTAPIALLREDSVKVLRKVIAARKLATLPIAHTEHGHLAIGDQKIVTAPLEGAKIDTSAREVCALVTAREIAPAFKIACTRANDTTRDRFSSVWLSMRGRRLAVHATNGAALSVRAVVSEHTGATLDATVPVEWLSTVADVLARCDSSAQVEILQGAETVEIVAPRYRAVCTRDNKAWTDAMRNVFNQIVTRVAHVATVDVDAESLRGALARAKIVAKTQKDAHVQVTVDDGAPMHLETCSPTMSVVETLEVAQAHALHKIVQYFHVESLAQLLGCARGNVRLHFGATEQAEGPLLVCFDADTIDAIAQCDGPETAERKRREAAAKRAEKARQERERNSYAYQNADRVRV